MRIWPPKCSLAVADFPPPSEHGLIHVGVIESSASSRLHAQEAARAALDSVPLIYAAGVPTGTPYSSTHRRIQYWTDELDSQTS